MTDISPGDCAVLAELLYGPDNTGSQFATRGELRTAWLEHRTTLLVLWGQIGRRPLGWWEVECPPGLKFDHDRERSTLWRAGILSEDERIELEMEWKREFERAFELAGDAKVRRRRYSWADIPAELVRIWSRERRRHK